MSDTTAYVVWSISIVIALVVTGVVALLLTQVLRTAQRIEGAAAHLWTTGKLVANNTVHIPQLIETNRHAGAILGTAVQIVAGAEAIERHVTGCPGCPACVLNGQA